MAVFKEMGGSVLAAANIVQNAEVVQLFAHNATVGTSFETISNTDADSLHPPILGEDIDVVSGSANDTAAGTGARTVRIWYLDANFLPQTEDITLSGTTPVEMTDQNITFINDAKILTTGTGLAAAGAITIAAVTGGEIFGVIDAGATRMAQNAYMVPANSTAYIYGFWAKVDPVAAGQGTVEVELQIAEFGTSGVVGSETYQTVQGLSLVELDSDIVAATGGNADGYGCFKFPVPYAVPAKAMIKLAGKAGSTAAAVTAGMQMVVHGSNAGTTTTNN